MHLRFNWQALQQRTGNDIFNICTITYNKENIIIMKFRSNLKMKIIAPSLNVCGVYLVFCQELHTIV